MTIPFPKSLTKSFFDFFGFPFRTVIFNESLVEKVGMTSLQQERINAVWPHLRGKILDIGAGNNRLVKLYKDGVGVDTYDWKNGAVVVKNSAELPFEDKSFDRVCFIACLNHIPNRVEVLKEAKRVLKNDGQLLITMIDPIIGVINHKLCWYEESHERGMEEGELDGLWQKQVQELLEQTGFRLVETTSFVYGLNKLYVATKA